jgi:heme A synthase
VEGELRGIHETLGGLVVVAFIVTVILASIAAAGRDDRWARRASFVAAGLLALQYLVGVLLLGNGARNSTIHYVIALLVLVPVALQHSSARRRLAQTRGLALLIWALAATFLSVIAYLTGIYRVG